MQQIRLDYDKTHSKAVIKCVPRLFGLIRDEFSCEDNAKKALVRRGFVGVDVNDYAITPSGMFDIWLVFEILKYLKSKGIEYSVEFSDKFREAFNSKFEFGYNSGENIFELELKLRDYQHEGVDIALSSGNGIFLYPTSAGKTLLMASIAHNILKRDPKAKILIVTLTHLVQQMVSDFASYGISRSIVSPWTGENRFSDTGIVVAGSTILSNTLSFNEAEEKRLLKIVKVCDKGLADKKSTEEQKAELRIKKAEAEQILRKGSEKSAFHAKIKKYLSSVNVVMVDEVHQCKKGNVITKLFSAIKTKHTFGFTGTMPNDKVDEWTVIGKVGPIRQKVERDKLVADGSIASVDVKFVDLSYAGHPKYRSLKDENNDENWTAALSNFKIESEFLYDSSFRNKVITKIASGVRKNVLVLVDRIEHGEKLKEMISKESPDKRVEFIYGEVDKDERERVRQLMESSDNVVCIAITKIFSTGVSIKNIHYIVFAVAWKTRVSIIQAIGRGVRAMLGKSKVVLFDIHDRLIYGSKHYKQRLDIYRKEGFNVTNVEIREGN